MSNPKIFLQPELIEGNNIDIAQDGKTISSNTPLENITNTDITEVEDGQALIYDETSGKWINGEGGTPIEPNPAAAATDTLSTIKIDNTVFSIGGGGTGDAVLYPLTTAEYNALTPEQKMDENVLYLLTDGGSGGGGGTGGGFYAPDYENPETITLTPLTWVTYNVTQNGYVMVDLTAFTETGGTSVKVNGTTLNFDKVDGTSYILNSTYMFPVMVNDVVEIRLNYDGSGYGSNTALFFPAKGEGGGGGGTGSGYSETTLWEGEQSITAWATPFTLPNVSAQDILDAYDALVFVNKRNDDTNIRSPYVLTSVMKNNPNKYFIILNPSDSLREVFVHYNADNDTIMLYSTTNYGYTLYQAIGIKYGGGGSNVIPNPEDEATDVLNSIKIDDTTYAIQGGGSFIDVENRIVALTEFTTSLTYTATEDCVVCMYLVCPGDASTFVKINDFTVQNFWQAELATGPCAPIFVRTGQTLTVIGAHTSYASNYTVYGVQSSGGGGGGTGNLNAVEMDYEDWLELPQEEREDPNIEYFLSNAPGGGGGGLNVTVTKILDQHIEITGEFALDDSIDSYDALLIGGYNYVSSSMSNQYKTTLILKEDYYKNTSNHADHILGNMTASTSGDNPRRVIFYFPDDTHINIQTRNFASIDKIFGLKFEQGGGSSEVNYSTEEQEIGTWIDGKPLYQITLELNASLNTTSWISVNIDSFVQNIKYITHFDAVTEVLPNNYNSTGTIYELQPWQNNGVQMIDIHCVSATGRNLKYLTIQYTKTTD